MCPKFFSFIITIVTVSYLVMLGCNKKNPIDPVVPFIPELNSPSDGALLVGDNPIQFSWSIVTSGTTTYTLQISKNSLFSKMVVNQSNIIPTHYSVTGLDTATTYYWRINATNSCGTSDWSEVRSFSIPYSHLMVKSIPAGDNPIGVVVLPDGKYVYVATDYNISVIRTSDNTILTTIPVYMAKNITTLSNGEYVYAGCGDIQVIRTLDNTIVSTIPIEHPLSDIISHPNGEYVYGIASWNDQGEWKGSVFVIRTFDNKIVKTIPIDEQPCKIAILPNGKYIYIAHEFLMRISVIRTSDNTLVNTISDNIGAPNGLTILPNGEYIYMSAQYHIDVIQTKDNVAVKRIGISFSYEHDIVAIPNGRYVYVTSPERGKISVIRTSDNLLVASIPIGGKPDRIAVLPNGEYIYVTDQDNNDVLVIRVFQ